MCIMDPDGPAPTFTLTPSNSSFTVERTEDNCAQIKVARGSYLNFEDGPGTHAVTLDVTDGLDSNGNSDGKVDASIAVKITVTDVAESARLTLSHRRLASIPGPILVTASPSQPPLPAGQVFYIWQGRSSGGSVDWEHSSGTSETVSISQQQVGERQYRAIAQYEADGITKTLESSWYTVNWTESR